MKLTLAALTFANFILLVFLATQVRPAEAGAQAGVLRGSSLEIVDDKGRVRASIKVHPADPNYLMPDGTRGYGDTAILRLIDPEGRPGVKLAVGGGTTGFLLMGDTDTTFVRLMARGKESWVEVKDDGREANTIKGSPVATK
jgi:hypothetical protein